MRGNGIALRKRQFENLPNVASRSTSFLVFSISSFVRFSSSSAAWSQLMRLSLRSCAWLRFIRSCSRTSIRSSQRPQFFSGLGMGGRKRQSARLGSFEPGTKIKTDWRISHSTTFFAKRFLFAFYDDPMILSSVSSSFASSGGSYHQFLNRFLRQLFHFLLIECLFPIRLTLSCIRMIHPPNLGHPRTLAHHVIVSSGWFSS